MLRILPARAARQATAPRPHSPAPRSPTNATAPDPDVSTPRRASERSMPRDDVRSRVCGQPIEIRHVLGVHLHRTASPRAPRIQPAADERLDAGVNVRAVERGDAGVRKAIHVRHRVTALDRSVAAGQLPSALDQAGDRIPGRQLDARLPSSLRWQRHGRHVAVPERARADAGDAEPRTAVGVGTRDVGVGGHPVVRVGDALLRR